MHQACRAVSFFLYIDFLCEKASVKRSILFASTKNKETKGVCNDNSFASPCSFTGSEPCVSNRIS